MLLATLRDALSISPGFAGMLMVWAFHQSVTFMHVITSFTEAEAAATAVERVIALADDTPQEAAHGPLGANAALQLPLSTPALQGEGTEALVEAPDGWPWREEVVFEDVRLRYRDGLPPALNGLSFKVEAGTRCGIVGCV